MLSIIQSPNSTIPTSTEEGGWIATAVPLVSMITTPLAAASVHILGQKTSMAIMITPFLISWFMIAIATSPIELISARAVSGIGMAFCYTVVPIYLGEIAPINLRSMIGLSMTVVNNLGILWIYTIGPIVNLWVSSLSCSIPLLVFLFLYNFIPESPYDLMKKKQYEKAKMVLNEIRNQDTTDEYAIMKTFVVKINLKESFKELRTNARHQRAIFICVGCFFMSQFTGGITFVFYTHLVFQRAGNVSPNTLAIIKATLQLISAILSTYVVERTGKRPLLMISCIGSTVFMGIEGLYFYLLDNKYNVEPIWWLPLVAMILFTMFQVIGLQSVPISFLGELFDSNIKHIGVCISRMSLSFSVFIVGKVFQVLVDNYGNAMPFFVFATMSFLALFFVIVFVPETRGRSLEEIQYYLKYRTYNKVAKEEKN